MEFVLRSPFGSCFERGGGNMRPLIERLTYMQDVTICAFDILAASMELEKVYTLIDKRDNTPYKIALLKDGNIWMVENLRIANYLCTPEDSDITDGSYQIPASSLLTDMKNITATTDNVYIHQPFNTGYYSIKTITAGTYAGESATAIGSIMPRGWKLASPEDFDSLVKTYPTEEERIKTPIPGMTRYGNAEGGALANQGYGYYWTNYGSHYLRVQGGGTNDSRNTCAFMARGIVRKDNNA